MRSCAAGSCRRWSTASCSRCPSSSPTASATAARRCGSTCAACAAASASTCTTPCRRSRRCTAAREVDRDRESGRGLLIVSAVADEVGVRAGARRRQARLRVLRHLTAGALASETARGRNARGLTGTRPWQAAACRPLPRTPRACAADCTRSARSRPCRRRCPSSGSPGSGPRRRPGAPGRPTAQARRGVHRQRGLPPRPLEPAGRRALQAARPHGDLRLRRGVVRPARTGPAARAAPAPARRRRGRPRRRRRRQGGAARRATAASPTCSTW